MCHQANAREKTGLMQPTLLVVDDDTSNLASLVRIFEKLELRTLARQTAKKHFQSFDKKRRGDSNRSDDAPNERYRVAAER